MPAALSIYEVANQLFDQLFEEFQSNLADLPSKQIEAKLVDILTAKLEPTLGTSVPPEVQLQVRALAYSLQRSFLAALKDQDMDIELGKVLKVGKKFTHEYDFGSTTELTLKVVAEREGIVMDEKDVFHILARNQLPIIPCYVCGKPATRVVAGYFYVEDNALCATCRPADGEYEDMFLPIVNSPRVGVCGYTGENDGIEWEELEEDDEVTEEETEETE